MKTISEEEELELARQAHFTVTTAVRERDAETLAKVVNFLRFGKGMNYERILKFINRSAKLSRAAFDEMMQEADDAGW